jgi:hypothetical protein
MFFFILYLVKYYNLDNNKEYRKTTFIINCIHKDNFTIIVEYCGYLVNL